MALPVEPPRQPRPSDLASERAVLPGGGGSGALAPPLQVLPIPPFTHGVVSRPATAGLPAPARRSGGPRVGLAPRARRAVGSLRRLLRHAVRRNGRTGPVRG